MKKAFCIVLCIVITAPLPGCWSRREPKALALVNSALYDINDEGGYRLTTEVINPSALGNATGGGDGKSPNITIISEGSSIPEAIRNVAESLERTIFGGHNKARFFSERFAQKDMVSILDYILRDRLTDENPLIIIIKDEDPEKVYSCMLGLSDTVGDYIESISKTQPDLTAKSVFIQTLDFIKDYYNEGKQPVAGVVELVECGSKPSGNTVTDSEGAAASQGSGGAEEGSGKEHRIKHDGLAAFKDDKLVGYMNGTEARAYNLVVNNMGQSVVSIPPEDDRTVVSINKSKASIKTETENDNVTINVKLKINMSVVQQSVAVDIRKAESLKKIEADFNKQMSEEIAAAVKKAQTEFQSDIFGFGVFVHKQHPEKWKELKKNWDDHFAGAKINVSVESVIDRAGEIKQPFRLEG